MIKKYLGQLDAYLDLIQKYFSRVSSIMIWIGFFTYMSERFDFLLLVFICIGLIIGIIVLVWVDVKFILPNKQFYLGNKNPFYKLMIKELKDEKMQK